MILKNKKFTIILVLAILIILVFVGYKWYEGKMKLVERGLADPKFPYHEYTLLELMRIRPGGDLNDEMRTEFEKQLKNLPTRITPLETLDKYIQALKDGDIEKAVECIREEMQRHELEDLNEIKKEGKMEEAIKYLEGIKSKIIWNIEKIEKGSTGRLEISYEYPCELDGRQIVCHLEFTKDLYGDWKMD